VFSTCYALFFRYSLAPFRGGLWRHRVQVADCARRVPTLRDIGSSTYPLGGERRLFCTAQPWTFRGEGDRSMSLTHAVVLTDHQAARVLHFDAAHVEAQKIRASSHYTRQHHSGVRTEHEFFGEVCDAVNEVDEVL